MSAQPFAGLNVVEFGAFGAGPLVAKFLADFGAEVIRVESRVAPDGFRTYPPFKDNIPGPERSGCMAVFNNNKMGIGLNLRKPQGVELAKRLVARADVVTENFVPGVMERLGLGYEELSKVKPDIIMLSTCNQGQTGPHAKHPGFGSHLTSLSGFTYLTGWPDRDPVVLYGPYIDFIGVAYGAIAVLAALDYRRRTGKGQHIDNAQYENGLQFVLPILLDFVVNGRIAERMGNRCSYAAPHGAYPCRGEDRWCVIAVSSDEEWQMLCQVMDHPEWGEDPRFATLLARKQNEDELDELIAEWTRNFTAEQVMERLQMVGVAAGVVQDGRDIHFDPQLKRYLWRELEHPVMGKHPYLGDIFHLSKTPGQVRMPCFLLGQHTRYVFTELLGMSEQEFTELAEAGVLEQAEMAQ